MNKNLTEQELRKWILSLHPSAIQCLEQTLKSIRDQRYEEEEKTKVTTVNTLTSGTNLTINSPASDNNVSAGSKSVITTAASNGSFVEYKIKPEPSDGHYSPSRTLSPTSSNFSNHSRSKIGKTYENGRRNLKEEDVSEEEATRRSKRRERNRLAAAKCRKRRQDKIETLQTRVTKLRKEIEQLSGQTERNSAERVKLEDIFNKHQCCLRRQTSAAAGGGGGGGGLAACNTTNLKVSSLSDNIISTTTTTTTTSTTINTTTNTTISGSAKRPSSLPIDVNNKTMAINRIPNTAAAANSTNGTSNGCYTNVHNNSTSTGSSNNNNNGNGSTSTSTNSVVISVSPQIVNLSPLFTPSTMKLLLDTIAGSGNSNTSNGGNGGNNNNNNNLIDQVTPTATPTGTNGGTNNNNNNTITNLITTPNCSSSSSSSSTSTAPSTDQYTLQTLQSLLTSTPTPISTLNNNKNLTLQSLVNISSFSLSSSNQNTPTAVTIDSNNYSLLPIDMLENISNNTSDSNHNHRNNNNNNNSSNNNNNNPTVFSRSLSLLNLLSSPNSDLLNSLLSSSPSSNQVSHNVKSINMDVSNGELGDSINHQS